MKEQILVMLQMQRRMNAKVHPQWETQGFEWYRAIWIECAELMDHYGWKWWKKQSPDRDQVMLELVDIWHFGMSDLLQRSSDSPKLAETLAKELDFTPVEQPFLALVETFASEVLANQRFSACLFAPLLASMNVSFEQLYRQYVGKNVLNFFRQDHGYKEGTYQKLWQGKEDNEHLVEVLAYLDDTALTFEQDLYSALLERYSRTIDVE